MARPSLNPDVIAHIQRLSRGGTRPPVIRKILESYGHHVSAPTIAKYSVEADTPPADVADGPAAAVELSPGEATRLAYLRAAERLREIAAELGSGELAEELDALATTIAPLDA